MEALIFIALSVFGLFIVTYFLLRYNLLAPLTIKQRTFIKGNSNNENLNAWEKSFMRSMKFYDKQDREPSFKQNNALNRIIRKITPSKISKSKPKPQEKIVQPKPKPTEIIVKPIRNIINTVNPLPKSEPKPEPKFNQQSRENARTNMRDQHSLYLEFLNYNGIEKLPKGSSMNWLEISSLMGKLRDRSRDYKSDIVLDQIDLTLEYDENLAILEEFYPDSKEKEIRNQIYDDKVEQKREYLMNFYKTKAQDNPSKAVKDSQMRNEPVRKIIPGNANKRWLKNPFDKTGGDYIGIDDGSNPLYFDDFSDESITQEKNIKKRAKSKYEQEYIDQGSKTQKHFQKWINAKENYGREYKTTQYHYKNYRSSLDKQQRLINKYRDQI